MHPEMDRKWGLLAIIIVGDKVFIAERRSKTQKRQQKTGIPERIIAKAAKAAKPARKADNREPKGDPDQLQKRSGPKRVRFI